MCGGRIGRAVRVYLDSAQLLLYRVHYRVKSVTTYITAVAERHTPLPWWSAIFSPAALSQTVVGVCWDARRDKGDCVHGLMYVSVCVCKMFVCPGVCRFLLKTHRCLPCLAWLSLVSAVLIRITVQQQLRWPWWELHSLIKLAKWGC